MHKNSLLFSLYAITKTAADKISKANWSEYYDNHVYVYQCRLFKQSKGYNK